MPTNSPPIGNPSVPASDFGQGTTVDDLRAALQNATDHPVFTRGPCLQGIWAEYAHTLDPEQWVKVWLINIWFPDDYYGLCQVKDLMSVIDTDYAPFDEYALQPCDSNGNLIEFEGVGELQS